ncbi:hypothetical protein [Klenkia taihuensis]|uniref:Uncharacterized protein n=1 Tax=Klenkia taihuensis TaxID=1225127 RepID=A0A1I1MVD0_9ACTN|nr:hypothetical protein [Klenkia taihuensis]GHE12634.1 hypothetical protein GCM10011381_31400 [Klenkia taihuensis]SFC86523.1 hypothetical protein SAMN05661030_1744 [Klenkia taihuensis]
MSPLRWDVLGAAALFAVPVLLLGALGTLDTDVVVARLPWCLLAGWVVSSLLRAVFPAPKPEPKGRRRPHPAVEAAEPADA